MSAVIDRIWATNSFGAIFLSGVYDGGDKMKTWLTSVYQDKIY